MRRLDVVRHLGQHGCQLLHEGGKHSIFVNRSEGRTTAVPRHREINEFLVRKICRDLEIPEP